MRCTRRTVVSVVIFGLTSGASASTKWSCEYAGFDAAHSPVQVQYQVGRSDVSYTFADGTGGTPYRILQNNELALVAASGGALPGWMVPEHGIQIGTATILIKKDTGDFV